MVKLSICIATYNRAAFIGETLESILNQIVPGVEVVIVDGASSDNTSEVMRKYMARFPGIRYFREEKNSGVDRDYDKAVGYAEGKYCWLMTDDDLLCPGAVSRVLRSIESAADLLVVNAEVRNADLSRVLIPRLLSFPEVRDYTADDGEKFFSEAANCLSFIGSVVVRRAFWLARERASYYGTLFIHVGVIFQHPHVRRVKVISEPQIIIRYGNAMWTTRGFDIWMFKWPRLIWSFSDFSDIAKTVVCPREPWTHPKQLVLYRAIGGYTLNEYRELLLGKATGISRVMCLVVALTPATVVNLFASLYLVVFNPKNRAAMYDISRSKYATWASRFAAQVINV